MRYHFILLKTFAPQRAVFYFFMTFLSDAGGHLDLGINLEWPYVTWMEGNSCSLREMKASAQSAMFLAA